jgi:2-methylisocitrate lyase-like PEP mutase family enzyme
MTRSAADKRIALARVVADETTTAIVPGVFEMISAKLADRQGFPALYLTGYGVAASHLGLPDAGLASFTDLLERVRVIADGTQTPLIVDADTGFGGLLNVAHTMRQLEAAGAAAIQLEDQVTPKRCGLTGPCAVTPVDDMLRKIAVALDARTDANTLLIARTDAHGEHGLDAAIERGVRFAEAGADVVFVQGIETEEQLQTFCARSPKPSLVNLAGAAALAGLTAEALAATGCRIAIHPGVGMLAAAAALQEVYATLRQEGSLAGFDTALLGRDEMNRLVGFEAVWEFESRWLDSEESRDTAT